MLNHHRTLRRGAVACGAAVALALLAAGAQAQVTRPTDPGVMSFPNVRVISTPPGTAERSGAPAHAGGFRAFIDPETGALTQNPSPAQIEEIQAIDKGTVRTKAFAAAPPRLHASGAVGARLDESYMSHMVVRRGASGYVDIACVDGDDKAMSFLAGEPRPAPAIRRLEMLK